MTSPSDINAGKAVIGVVLDDSTIKQQMEGTAARMQASAAGIHASTISTLKDQLKAGTITQEEYTAAVNRSKKSLDGAAMSAKETGKAVKTTGDIFGGMKTQIAAYVAGFATLATVTSAIRAVGAEFKAIKDEALLAEKLGMTAKSFVGMKIAAQQADVEMETFTGAIVKMSIAIGKARMEGSESAKWLDRIGLSLKDLSDLGTDEQFLRIAQAMRDTLSPSEQLAASTELFGRNTSDMVRLLQLTREGLAETTAEAVKTGQAMDDFNIAKIKEANDAIDSLKNTWEGLKRSVAVTAAPVVGPAARAVELYFRTRGFTTGFGGEVIEVVRDEVTSPNADGKQDQAKTLGNRDTDRSIAEDTDREERARESAKLTDEYAEQFASEMERNILASAARAKSEAYITEQTNEYARMFEASINAPLIAEESKRRAAAMEAAKTRTTAEGTFSGWRLGDQFTQQAVEKEQLTELKKMNDGFRKLLIKIGVKKPDFYT